MKIYWTTRLLVILLCLGGIGAASLTATYLRYKKRLHRLQNQAALINQQRSILQSLAGEAAEYSRRNPAIEPLLREMGIRTRPWRGPSPNPPGALPEK